MSAWAYPLGVVDGLEHCHRWIERPVDEGGPLGACSDEALRLCVACRDVGHEQSIGGVHRGRR
jgi:hypothetical protein